MSGKNILISLGKAKLTLSPDQVELAYRKVPTLPDRVSTNVRRSGLASRQASWLVLAISWVCKTGPGRVSTVADADDRMVREIALLTLYMRPSVPILILPSNELVFLVSSSHRGS